MNNRAQGTIEYLIIIAIVVVISLVVVGLLIAQVDNSSGVSNTASKITTKIGVNGISLSSSVMGEDTNGLLVIKNVGSDNLTLNKIIIDGVNHNFSEQIVTGSEKSFKLQDITSCDGEKKNYSVKIEYISANGLTKIADFENISLDCTSTVIPANVAVEETLNVVPSIELSSPADDSSDTETRVSFVFTPSDSDGTISDCNLNITGVMDANDSSSITPDEENTLEYTLSVGSYDWNISCIDNSGDINTSTTRTITINQLGNALDFDGINDYINTGITDTITSLSFWFNGDSNSTMTLPAGHMEGTEWGGLVSQGTTDSTGWQLRRYATGLNTKLKIGGTDYTVNGLSFDGNWHHVVIVRDSINTTTYVYVDNVLKLEENSIWTTSGTLMLGKANQYPRMLRGDLDEVLIFNRILDDSEITQLYNDGDGLYANTGNSPFDDGLIAGYHFDEGSGTTVDDLVGSNDGTIIGSPIWVDGKLIIP
ncbi:MAG: LamG domain-containing protein [Sphaerochaetaceae bacterium]|nr:LamG domain-containing protein [Sphaerochaetaceae bacterium]